MKHDTEANGGSNAGSSGEDQDKEAAGAASADGGKRRLIKPEQ